MFNGFSYGLFKNFRKWVQKNKAPKVLAMATYIAPIAAVFTIAIIVFALHIVFCRKDRAYQLRTLDNKKADVSEEEGFDAKEWSNLNKTDCYRISVAILSPSLCPSSFHRRISQL